LRDVDEEVRLHLELRVEELVREGWDGAAAQAEARRRFAREGETLRLLYEAARDRNQYMRMRQRWEGLVQDARYAARGLLRDPVLALFIVIMLALGVGANVTAFSLVDRLLLRGPEHVLEEDRLVRMYARVPTAAGEETSSWIPYAAYRALSAGMTRFSAVGAYRVSEARAGRGLDARKIRLGQTTGAFFAVLGVQPLRGRFFAAQEDAARTGPLAVLSESVWRSDYGGEPSVLGATIVIDDQPHTIVGVAPAGFSGTELRRVDAWVLADSRTIRNVNWNTVGRLRPGVAIAAASAEARAVHARTSGSGPRWMREAMMFGAPIRFDATGREPLEATMARWLAAVSTIILLITFANIVNLLLVRLSRQRRELAIRVALGSGRARVMRLLVIQGVLLAVASGVASLLVARVVEPMVRTALFADEAAWTFSLSDARVLGTLLVIIVVTGVVVGIVPALRAGSPQITAALRTGGQGGPGSSRTRSALTVLQAALSVVLLVGAGLFVRSLANVRALDLGVDPERVIAITAEQDRRAVPTEAGIRDFAAHERALYRRLLEAVRRLPGVERAGIALGMPFDGGSFGANVWVPGMDSVPVLSFRGPYISAVTSDYFSTMGTRLVRGRVFTESDREGSEPVAIAGETMARTLWPDRDAVGACFRFGFATAPCARIVGVVADVHRLGLRAEQSLQYYVPLGQTGGMFAGATLVVRGTRSAPVSMATLRKTIFETEPTVRSVEMALLSSRLDGELRPLRLGMLTFGLSGGLALLVAVLGLYSLMSYMVAWRTREIGVRLALGASNVQLTRLVVGSGTALAALGVLIGLALTLAGAPLLQPHLFDASALDPVVLAVVAAVLLMVALLAGWLPARRALRISPTESLRAE
jgi:predicted permease